LASSKEAVAAEGGQMTDVVNPEHYTKYRIQPVDVIDDWSLDFYLGNVVKYIARYRDKGGVEDLRKACWYLDRFISLQAKQQEGVTVLPSHNVSISKLRHPRLEFA